MSAPPSQPEEAPREYPPIAVEESEMEEDGTDPEDESDEEEDRTEEAVDQKPSESSEEEEEEEEEEESPSVQTIPAASPIPPADLSQQPAPPAVAFSRYVPLPRTTTRHADPQMASAHRAINESVIDVNQSLSTTARNLLFERQKSELRLRAEKNQRSGSPTRERRESQPQSSPTSSKRKQRSSHSTTAASNVQAPPPESLSVFRLTALNQLLQHAKKGSFIMLDLDETLVMTKHQPALLLSSYGVRMFQSYVRSTFSDFATKNRLCRQLEAALKDKCLVESDTAIVVAQLQKAGCWVFGVTARYPELATNTQRTLLSLGISLGSSAPFPSTVIKDPVTEAVFSDGVIYCGRESKAKVVSRFLENVVFAQLLQRAQHEARLEEERLKREAEEKAAASEAASASGTGTDGEEMHDLSTPLPTPSRAPSLRPSPSMVSIGSDTPNSPTPNDSQRSTPAMMGGEFMTPTPSNRRSDSSGHPAGEMTPLPIDHVLRGNHSTSADFALPEGLKFHPLMRSVSSPAAMNLLDQTTPGTPSHGNGETIPMQMQLPVQSELTPTGSNFTSPSPMPISSAVPSSSTLSLPHRSLGGISRALTLAASPLLLGAAQRSNMAHNGERTARRMREQRRAMRSGMGARAVTAGGGEDDESQADTPTAASLKTPSKLPASSSSLRRAMSFQSPLPSTGLAPSLTATISKRARSNQWASGQKRESKRAQARAERDAVKRRARIKVKARVPRSALPPEVIFVDNEVQHVTEMQSNLTIAKKLKIPLICYCFAPQTKEELEKAERQREEEAQRKQKEAETLQAQQEAHPTDQAHPASSTSDGTGEDEDDHPSHIARLANGLSQISLEATTSGASSSTLSSVEPPSAITISSSPEPQEPTTPPLPSPTTQSIVSGLSLQSLTSTPSSSHLASSSGVGSGTIGMAPGGSSSTGAASGIYGFMLALGNVLPSSAVSSGGAQTQKASFAHVVQLANARAAIQAALDAQLAVAAAEEEAKQVGAAMLDTVHEHDAALSASSLELPAASTVPSTQSSSSTSTTHSHDIDIGSIASRRNAQLYDSEEEEAATVEADENVAETVEAVETTGIDADASGITEPDTSAAPIAYTSTNLPITAVLSDEPSESDDTLTPLPTPSLRAHPAPRYAARGISFASPLSHTSGASAASAASGTSGTEDTEAETEGEGERTEDGTATEYTDATTEYTDETQTETDGGESDAGRSQSLAANGGLPRIPSSHSLNGASIPASASPPLPVLLMPSTKQRPPVEAEPIPGLSTTESLEVAAAALGAESINVLQVQMQTFAATGVILSNQQALEKLRQQEEEEEEETEDEEDEDEEDEDNEEEA
jgi:hypothetical protein